jgi:hypothetical protein
VVHGYGGLTAAAQRNFSSLATLGPIRDPGLLTRLQGYSKSTVTVSQHVSGIPQTAQAIPVRTIPLVSGAIGSTVLTRIEGQRIPVNSGPQISHKVIPFKLVGNDSVASALGGALVSQTVGQSLANALSLESWLLQILVQTARESPQGPEAHVWQSAWAKREALGSLDKVPHVFGAASDAVEPYTLDSRLFILVRQVNNDPSTPSSIVFGVAWARRGNYKPWPIQDSAVELVAETVRAHRQARRQSHASSFSWSHYLANISRKTGVQNGRRWCSGAFSEATI